MHNISEPAVKSLDEFKQNMNKNMRKTWVPASKTKGPALNRLIDVKEKC